MMGLTGSTDGPALLLSKLETTQVMIKPAAFYIMLSHPAMIPGQVFAKSLICKQVELVFHIARGTGHPLQVCVVTSQLHDKP